MQCGDGVQEIGELAKLNRFPLRRALMTAIEPIHPGEHLAEIMEELGITQYRLAKGVGRECSAGEGVGHGSADVTHRPVVEVAGAAHEQGAPHGVQAVAVHHRLGG